MGLMNDVRLGGVSNLVDWGIICIFVVGRGIIGGGKIKVFVVLDEKREI